MGAGAIRWRRSRPDRACTSSWPRIRRRRTCLTALRNTSIASAESTPANHPMMSAHRAGLQSLSTLHRGSAPGRFGTNGPTQQNPRPRERNVNGARLIAVSGVVFSVVLLIVGLALTPAHAPNSISAGATIAQYVGAHRGELLLSYFLTALSVLPFFVFIAALYRLMRRAEGDDGWVALTALMGGIVGAALFFVSSSLWATVAYRPGQDPAILRALTDASWITVAFSEVAFATFIGATSFAVLRTRVLPAWSGWVGVPVAVVTLIGAAALVRGAGHSRRKAR